MRKKTSVDYEVDDYVDTTPSRLDQLTTRSRLEQQQRYAAGWRRNMAAAAAVVVAVLVILYLKR